MRSGVHAAWAARCWCDSTSPLEPFGPDYFRCTACETLVFAGAPDISTAGVVDDDSDLYGSRFWTTHQLELGLPPIDERERTDLTHRCLHWLRALLRYRRPQARLLEIGAGHGGFVRLARLAGFDAVGIEMSPTIVERARRTFDVDMRLGPLESAGFADAAFDIVVSFDVLEHLAQPEATLHEIRRVLSPDGLLLAQTPDFREVAYSELHAAHDRFLDFLGPAHLFLFSKRSARAILMRTGFPNAVFEPPVFPYDMFFVAGSELPAARPADDVARTLLETSDGRIVLALLDLYEHDAALRTVAAERQAVIDGLSAACDERLALIERLDRELRDVR